MRADMILFSESQGRIVVTVAPVAATRFEELCRAIPHARIGKVSGGRHFLVKDAAGTTAVDATIDSMLKKHKSIFANY